MKSRKCNNILQKLKRSLCPRKQYYRKYGQKNHLTIRFFESSHEKVKKIENRLTMMNLVTSLTKPVTTCDKKVQTAENYNTLFVTIFKTPISVKNSQKTLQIRMKNILELNSNIPPQQSVKSSFECKLIGQWHCGSRMKTANKRLSFYLFRSD